MSARTIGWILILAFEPMHAEEVRPVAPVSADYQLVWQDEFNGGELDASKWAYRQLGPRRDAINVKDAVTLDGQGHLLITTSKHHDKNGKPTYHTGMIGTQGKFEATFGYFEVRMKVQSEVGHWSAFWLQSPTMGDPIGNPVQAGTEIDVIEYLCNGKYRNKAQHTIHWDGYQKDHKKRHKKATVPNMHEGFHTFAVEWTPKEYVFFVDGRETWRTREAISQRSEYLILSMEVGTWAGNIQEADLPDSMTVDYVRVFQRQPATAKDKASTN